MKRYLLLLFILVASVASAQTPITPSGETQMMNGRKYYVHVLQSGQTIYSIAKAYGVNTYDAVARKDIHKLSVGDTIWLPYNGQIVETNVPEPAKYRYIKVEAGQTLYSLSRKYGVSIEDLKLLNPELESGGLKSGQTLKIPADAEAPKPAATEVRPEGQPQAKAEAPVAIEIRNRIDPNIVYVSLMMPFSLDQLDSISTSKFDIEQRGKKSYRSFEFIQFYEGMLMGLDRLEQKGFQVVLNVVDMPATASIADVEKAFTSHNVAQSDFIIALLQRPAFEKVAELAKDNHVFVINPISTRGEIVENNPYVVKCMPSTESQVATILKTIKFNMPNAHLYLVHSNSKSEAAVRAEFQRQLDEMGDIRYTLFDWKVSNKFSSALKQTPNSVVVSIYDQSRDKNRIYVSNLLNKISAMKTNTPRLISLNDYTKEITDVDFGQLQHASYHTFYADFDDGQPAHRDFMEAFRDRFKTEPLNAYAGMANDIILYFVTGVSTKGSSFWKDPNIARPAGMLFPITLKRTAPTSGFENNTAMLYRMSDYHFISAKEK